MPTTSNFGWTTPADTDLVKDGALAIRTLGSSIDTSFVDLKGGTTGQVLSKASNTDLDYTWVTTDDANAIQNAIVDAKGDLIAASAADTPARLAVGNNGETLVADSAASTGLRWQGSYEAGKNKIINGDFYINQRAFTSNTTTGTFNFDRWRQINNGGTVTVTPQTFTAGAAPVAGYEGKNYLQIDVTGQSAAADRANIQQLIESVRTFANQTVTVSFWAKASSGTPSIAVELAQGFGTGGSPSAGVTTFVTKQQVSTSWARYSASVAVPSISGKTLGTANDDSLTLQFWFSAGSDFNARTSTLGTQTNTFQIWGVQVEAGSVATAFQTATGTLQGELAAAMRYCEKVEFASGSVLTVGQAYSTTAAWGGIGWTTQKRATPTITQTGTIQALQASTATSGTTFAYGTIGINNARMEHSGGSGLVAGNACIFQATGGTASLLITAEL